MNTIKKIIERTNPKMDPDWYLEPSQTKTINQLTNKAQINELLNQPNKKLNLIQVMAVPKPPTQNNQVFLLPANQQQQQPQIVFQQQPQQQQQRIVFQQQSQQPQIIFQQQPAQQQQQIIFQPQQQQQQGNMFRVPQSGYFLQQPNFVFQQQQPMSNNIIVANNGVIVPLGNRMTAATPITAIQLANNQSPLKNTPKVLLPQLPAIQPKQNVLNDTMDESIIFDDQKLPDFTISSSQLNSKRKLDDDLTQSSNKKSMSDLDGLSIQKSWSLDDLITSSVNNSLEASNSQDNAELSTEIIGSVTFEPDPVVSNGMAVDPKHVEPDVIDLTDSSTADPSTATNLGKFSKALRGIQKGKFASSEAAIKKYWKFVDVLKKSGKSVSNKHLIQRAHQRHILAKPSGQILAKPSDASTSQVNKLSVAYELPVKPVQIQTPPVEKKSDEEKIVSANQSLSKFNAEQAAQTTSFIKQLEENRKQLIQLNEKVVEKETTNRALMRSSYILDHKLFRKRKVKGYYNVTMKQQFRIKKRIRDALTEVSSHFLIYTIVVLMVPD